MITMLKCNCRCCSHVVDVGQGCAGCEREAREITGDDLLQASHPAATPGLEVLLGKQVHADQNVHWGHDRALLEHGRHRPRDPWVERVFAIRGEADRGAAVRGLRPHGAAIGSRDGAVPAELAVFAGCGITNIPTSMTIQM